MINPINPNTKQQVFDKLTKLPLDENAAILLLVHDDMDGEGAYMLLSLIYPNITCKRLTNGNMSIEIEKIFTEDIINDYDFVIAADISCSEKVCERIALHPAVGKFIILDHHTTADYLNKYSFGLCQSAVIADGETIKEFYEYFGDKNQTPIDKLHSSGTTLMFDYLAYQNLFVNTACASYYLYRLLAHYIRCYDTWDWHDHMKNMEICKDLSLLYAAYGADGFHTKIKQNIDHLCQGIADMNIVPIGRHNLLFTDDLFILQCEVNKANRFVESIQNSVRTGTLIASENGGVRYYSATYISCNKYLQEVFDMMKQNYKDTDIYIINYGSGLSFRTSRDDLHVGELCKQQWGGGGHKGAGGMKIAKDMLYNFVCHDILSGKLILDEKTK